MSMVRSRARSPPGLEKIGRLPVPARMWLPLHVLDLGPIYGKIRMQKLVFLIQYTTRSDFYDFKKHHYGPYSSELNLDMISYPDLVYSQMRESTTYQDSYYYSYELTNKGESYLPSLEKKVNPELVRRVDEALSQYSRLGTNRLLDLVYTNFALRKEDSAALEAKIH